MNDVSIPVSIGELIDKITILRIKTRRVDDPTKLRNVKTELEALLQTCQQHKFDLEHPLVRELETVNEALWDIEDDIRDKERAKTFDDRFIELARAVYRTNDRRFALKSDINTHFGSRFREEKSYQPY